MQSLTKAVHKGRSIDILVIVAMIFAVLTAIEIRFGGYFFVHDDNLQSYLCLYKHTFEGLKHGTLSLYNFHQFMGLPFVDDGQSGVFNPIVYIAVGLSYLFSGNAFATIDIMTYFYLAAAGISMYLLLGKLGVSRSVSVLGGIIWALNSFTINMARAWMITTMFTAWFPLMLFGSIVLMTRRDLKGYIIAAIPRVFMYYTGHPQFFVYGVLFEGITMLFYIVFMKAKIGVKFISAIRYGISYIPVVILSAPLLYIQYRATRYSGERSDQVVWGSFSAGKMQTAEVLKGLLLPWKKLPSYGVWTNFWNINANLGHVGYIVLYALVLIPIIVVVAIAHRKGRKLLRVIPFIPGCVIAFFWATNDRFLKFIYDIPMLNRFRFPFKLILIFDFFLVVIGCMLVHIVAEYVFNNSEKIKRAMLGLLVFVQVANYVVLYIFFPAPQYGINNSVTLPYESPYLEELSEGRIVTMGYSMYFPNGTYVPDNYYLESFGFNYATLFGVDNVLGYSVFLPKEFYGNLTSLGIAYCENASFVGTPEPLVDLMNQYGAKWYIVPKLHRDPSLYPECDLALRISGVKPYYETETAYIYKNENPLPLVYPVSEINAFDTVSFEENINDVTAHTTADFKADDVAMIYTYLYRLHAYVDGEEVELRQSADRTHLLVAVPDGAHEIVLRYEDERLWECFGLAVVSMTIFCFGMNFLISKTKFKTSSDEGIL